MPDMEKVINALHCRGQDLMIDLPACDGCDYQIQMVNRMGCDFRRLCKDAIALLKEQEAVKPIITPWAENEDGEVVIAKRECGRCGYQFFTEKPNYCENCGAPILWEDR